MDFIPDQETMRWWLLHYGFFSFFLLLALGVFALPVPDETLMVVAGALIKNGEMLFFPTYVAALLGSMAGITLSYVLGKTVGSRFLHRYGSIFGITEQKLEVAHNWFSHYGKWTLTFGYFIPGIRHLTGFAAGSSDLAFPQFALFAYTGAAIWATSFLSIGYFLGHYWKDFVVYWEEIDHYTLSGIGIGLALLALGYFVYRKWKRSG
jgi:membrane protein DedA with SNARE-associated domain